MRVWVLAGALLLAAQCAEGNCIEVSADPAPQSPVVEGLDSALAITLNLQIATICLIPSVMDFTVGVPFTVDTEVSIQGNEQFLNVLTVVEVRGFLTIQNVTLTSRLTSTEIAILALNGGAVLIRNSSVQSNGASLIKGQGEVILERTNFSDNTAPIVAISKAGNTLVKVLYCSVWSHFGEFLSISPLISTGAISVSIEQSSFRENAGAGFLISCSAPLLSGNFSIIDTEFLLNTIPLLNFDISGIQVSITRSTFIDNSQSTVTVNARGSVFTIEDSQWKKNSNIVFDFRQFTGHLVVARITVQNQRWKGIFKISNTQSPSLCLFTIDESLFRHIYFKVDEWSPCLISSVGCGIQMTETTINDVRCAATRQSYMEGLILVRMGDIDISRMSLYSSGSAGTGMGLAMGDFTISDSLLYDIHSGTNIYIGFSLGNFYAKNVTISQGSGFPLDDINVGTISTYMFAFSSEMEVIDLKIIPGPMVLFDYPRYLIATRSNVNIRDIQIDGYSLGTFAGFFEATGLIRNITVLNCMLNNVFFVNNHELLRFADIVLANITIKLDDSLGLFYSSPAMIIECANFTISNLTTNYFAASKKSRIRLFNITISDSEFQCLLMYQLDSYISIEQMTFRDSTGAFASLFRSSLLIVGSLFENIISRSFIFEGEEVNMTLDRVVMKNISSPAGISDFKEKSQFTISQSMFEHFYVTADVAFLQNTGMFAVTDSSFRFFNAVFFQAKSCSIHIAFSIFQEGRSKALSQTSDTAYGGALGCTDCTSVVIEHSSFLNVSAIFGGAVAVRSPNNLYSPSVHIVGGEFLMCTASAGGAVYVTQSSLLLEDSQFIGNSAKLTGGAIDVYSSNEEIAKIRNCTFYRNSAHEGGAIKWNDAEVTFVNATFQDNSAVYGPDVASFGNKLLGKVISSNTTETSCYPLNLMFELQDHYGQRVITASTQVLQLNSNDQINYLGNTVVTVEQGIFNFSHLTIYAQPNSTQQVSGEMLTILNQDKIMAFVNITFRDCVPGEVRKSDRCEYCFASNVSFFKSDINCNYCPRHAFCPGGNVLIVDPHYWRNSTNSTDMQLCPLSVNCFGGEHSDCAEGYTGKLCNECSEDNTRIRILECESCGSRIVQYCKVLLVAVPISGFVIAVRKATDTQYFILKNIFNHAQLLYTLSYLRVPLPSVIKYFLHSLSYISSLFVTELPISCFTSRHSEYKKVIIGSAIPFSLYLLIILLNRRNMKKAWVMCTSAMMFLPAISLSTLMQLLPCQSVNLKSEYLFVDMQEKCWEGLHLLLIYALAIPAAIINVLLPIALVTVISIASPKKFDELFPLWRTGLTWRCWDLWVYSGKAVLICFAVASQVVGQLSQVTYSLLVLIIMSIVCVGMSSYAYTHWKLFALAEFSLVITAVSIGLCSYFIYHSSVNGVASWLVTAGLLVPSVVYFAVCAKLWSHPPDLRAYSPSQSLERNLSVPQNSRVEFECSH